MKDATRVLSYQARHRRYGWVMRTLRLTKPRPTARAPRVWEW